MTSGYQAILDACVLVNPALRDTLLRLTELPQSYLPRWSADIIAETKRTLETKLHVPSEKTAYLERELRKHFPDAWVEGYESLIPVMGNHPKDRHVLAVAVRTGAQAIVTLNLKDFPEEALSPWDVIAQSPDDFLIHQYHLDPEGMMAVLNLQVTELRNGSMERLLTAHSKVVPVFVGLVRAHIQTKR